MPDDIHEIIAELRAKVAYLNDEVTNMRGDISEMKKEINKILVKLGNIEGKLNNYGTMSLLIKYVITPLIVILGALVGVKIVLP
ncbi:MAG: hypothetical protein DRJ38_08685 [Thermoprotei archaeon]|nr:MAG: hypothetical protein DRJ38_08685 [Thermoprotei archaeon]